MRSFLRCVTLLVWALWFGGVMGLFLSVQVLFHQTERAVFLQSAPRLFIAFEKYQLFLAATALLVTFAARIFSPSSRWTRLFILFAIATLGAVIETTQLTPRIEALRLAGQTHTPEFMRLHGMSMAVYMAVAITLLVTGILQSFSSVGNVSPSLAGPLAGRFGEVPTNGPRAGRLN